jgi:hypothetical protein
MRGERKANAWPGPGWAKAVPLAGDGRGGACQVAYVTATTLRPSRTAKDDVALTKNAVGLPPSRLSLAFGDSRRRAQVEAFVVCAFTLMTGVLAHVELDLTELHGAVPGPITKSWGEPLAGGI